MLKILSLLFALFFIGTNVSYSQSRETNLTEEHKKKLEEYFTSSGMTTAQKTAFIKDIEEYFTALNLSEKQKLTFEAITKKYALQMKELKEQDSGSMFEKYQEFESIMKSKNEEMKELLTRKQYEVYENKQLEVRNKLIEKL